MSHKVDVPKLKKELKDSINSRITEFIDSLGLSRNKICKVMGINSELISRTLKNKEPSFAIIALLQKYFNLNINWLFTGEGNSKIDEYTVELDPSNQSSDRILELLLLLQQSTALRDHLFSEQLVFMFKNKDLVEFEVKEWKAKFGSKSGTKE